jgi:hypothetical protein
MYVNNGRVVVVNAAAVGLAPGRNRNGSFQKLFISHSKRVDGTLFIIEEANGLLADSNVCEAYIHMLPKYVTMHC